MDKKQIEILTQKIRRAESILIFGHKNTDGDSLGSVLALRDLIRDNMGKVADVMYDGNLPDIYDFMPGRADIKYAEKKRMKKYDLAIALDVASRDKMGLLQAKFFDNAADTVKIDHHKTEQDFANLDIVGTDFVATCEIIYEIAKMLNWNISPIVAQNIYTGIWTDTGGFNFVDNGNVFRVAAQLVDLGADARIVRPKLEVLTRQDIAAEGAVLASTEFFFRGKLAVATVPNKLYKRLDSGEVPLLMRLRSVRGVSAVVIMKEAKYDVIRTSFRSERVNVREIAEKLGGGGHDLAAAANIYSDLESAKKTIVAAFNNKL